MAGFQVSKARLNVFLLLTNPSSSKAIEILMPLGVWAVYSVISGFLSAIESGCEAERIWRFWVNRESSDIKAVCVSLLVDCCYIGQFGLICQPNFDCGESCLLPGVC
jgi:hypothetical protein